MSATTKPKPKATTSKTPRVMRAESKSDSGKAGAFERLKRFSQQKGSETTGLLLPSDVQILLDELTAFRRAAGQAGGRSGTPAKAKVSTDDDKLVPLELSARLRDPITGRLDARQFIQLLGISAADLATKVCGVTRQALNQSPTSAGIQVKLAILEEIAGLLTWCGSEARLRAWLKRPNRDFAPLNGKILSPMELILMGHADLIANEAHNLRTGNPS